MFTNSFYVSVAMQPLPLLCPCKSTCVGLASGETLTSANLLANLLANRRFALALARRFVWPTQIFDLRRRRLCKSKICTPTHLLGQEGVQISLQVPTTCKLTCWCTNRMVLQCKKARARFCFFVIILNKNKWNL